MAGEVAEIAQISLFLAKDGVDYEAVLDPEASFDQKKNKKVVDFAVSGVLCRFIYFETVSNKTNPTWLTFINEKLAVADRIDFNSTSDNPNSILLMCIDGRMFVAAFGRSAIVFLNKQKLEPDFGIKTAMNMCGNEEIRQTKTLSNVITTTFIDRQVSKPSDAFVFGLSEAEDLRYISAHMKGNKNITLQGKDSLTIKVLRDDRLDWSGLIDQCRIFKSKHGEKEYAKLFPNYKNFRPANEKESVELDEKLIKALKARSFSKLQFCIPDFIQDDQYSFSYTNRQSRDNDIYSHLDVSHLELFSLDDVDISRVRAKHVFAYSHFENKILPNMKWSLYECLVFECPHDSKYFLLRAGQWVEVDSQFYNTIVSFVKNDLREEAHETSYGGIDISDDVAKKNLESKFNEEVVSLRTTAVLFDRAKLQIGTGRKDKEFCDILDMCDDNVVRIINCKQYKDASSINYLFSQAKFYCDAFLHDENFLEEIRAHIEASPSSIKQTYLDYIPKKIEEINARDYRVCLWLLYNEIESKPQKENIPLISQYELKLMHDHLRKHCKFSEIIIRFIPVKTKSYKTPKSPKNATAKPPKKAKAPKKAAAIKAKKVSGGSV